MLAARVLTKSSNPQRVPVYSFLVLMTIQILEPMHLSITSTPTARSRPAIGGPYRGGAGGWQRQQGPPSGQAAGTPQHSARRASLITAARLRANLTLVMGERGECRHIKQTRQTTGMGAAYSQDVQHRYNGKP